MLVQRQEFQELIGRWGRRIGFALPVLFLLLFFGYPLATVLWQALAQGGLGLRTAFSDGYTWRVLGFSAWQASLSTGLTLLVGLPSAYLFARYRFPGRDLLRTIATVPFVMPTVVVAAAFAALIGPQGVLNTSLQAWFGLAQPPIRLQSTLTIILLAHLFYNYTVVIRLVGGFWSQLDPRLGEAAATLGVPPWRAFVTVTLPLLAPAIGAAALLVFIFTFTSFGVIVILGGARFATIEVAIYREISQLLRLEIAAALALLQGICTLVLSLIYTRLAARVSSPLGLQPRSVTVRRPRRWWEWAAIVGLALGVLTFFGGPLLALALRSIWLPGAPGPSLRFYMALSENLTGSAFFVPPQAAIVNSLRIAATTTVLALGLGLLAAYLLAGQGRRGGRWRILLDGLFMLPLGTSAVTLGLGFLIALSVPGLAPLRTSPWLVPLLHTLVALPFVIRALLPVLRGRDRQQLAAAATLGVVPWRAWLTVELPQIAPALGSGALFAFTTSLGEFGATLLLSRPDAPTLPVMIFRFLGRPGALNYGQAMALSTVLMILVGLSALLIERWRPPRSEM